GHILPVNIPVIIAAGGVGVNKIAPVEVITLASRGIMYPIGSGHYCLGSIVFVIKLSLVLVHSVVRTRTHIIVSIVIVIIRSVPVSVMRVRVTNYLVIVSPKLGLYLRAETANTQH